MMRNWILSVLLLYTPPLFAQCGHEEHATARAYPTPFGHVHPEVHIAFPASLADALPGLDITYPNPTEDVRATTFTLSFLINNPPDELNHFHYGVGPHGDGLANQGIFTATDLSGNVDIDLAYLLGYSPNDGEYDICTYMAAADHLHLSPTDCSTFTLRTTGLAIDYPLGNETMTSSDLDFLYSFFGNSITSVSVSLDGSLLFIDDGDGSFTLSGVSDGTHTLTLQGLDSSGISVGDPLVRSITVSSVLNRDNAARARRAVTRAIKSDNAALRKTLLLDEVIPTLERMELGGVRNPASAYLSQEHVAAAKKLANKASKKVKRSSFAKTLTKLDQLLKKMVKR